MTEAEARKRGYRLIQGVFVGTSDDVAGCWYIDDLNSNLIDKRGPGFPTKRAALEELATRIGSEP